MWTHRLAVFTAFATFVLLLIGGIVHGTGSSLACPDWPTCFGSFFPQMTGNVLVEHGHRLVASAVGLLTIVLCLSLYRDLHRPAREKGTPPERAARLRFYLGVLAVGLVCFQGVLGGLTVLLRLPALISAAHLATSMLFFSLLLALVCLTRPHAVATADSGGARQPVPDGTHRLLIGTTLLAYAQIALGGLVRHTGAGLACLDVPLCRGRVLPIGEHPTVLIQALHRLNALLCAGLLLVLSALVLRALRHVDAREARWPRLIARALPALVLLQIALGVMSVLSFLGLFYVTAHLGTGALILGGLVALTFLLRPEAALSSAGRAPVTTFIQGGGDLPGAVST
jgi:heme A synthase